MLGSWRTRGPAVLAVVLTGAAGCSESESVPDAPLGPPLIPVGVDAGATRPDSPQPEGWSDAAVVATPEASSGDGEMTGCQTFDGAYAAIQKIIFEGRGCTNSACHGEAKVGGLDLRADVSWESLVDAPSANSALARVQPGTANASFLYQKLQAATEPGSVAIAGSPMPVGTSPLSADELEAVRLWITKGAPKQGAVSDPLMGQDVGTLLDACLPPAKPVKAKPLEPPAPEEGIQFQMPSYLLKASSETEICIPFAYDFTDKVPERFKDTARNVMFVNGTRVRQDPQSHHLVLMNPKQALTSVRADDPDWICRGGARDGQRCDASKGSRDCGEGVCAGKVTVGTVCGLSRNSGDLINDVFGLLGLVAGGMPEQIANTQAPQAYLPPIPGVFSEIPLRGILYFNSHAFNLTPEDTTLEARVNYYYAQDRGRQLKPVNVIDNLKTAGGQPPFTKKTYCAKHVVPRHHHIAIMTGHTHRRGEHFWVKDATGQTIYENFDYNDPIYKHFEPWLSFDAADDRSRTLEYCATFNNGLKADGSPDLELVTRKSRLPAPTTCTPVACVAGKVAAACQTDRDCDSKAGANDGSCDACPIKTAGETTEDEMFVLMPWYVLPAGK